MSLSVVQSRAGLGTDAPTVSVEVHLSRGLPSFSIVGLASTEVKESRDRVRGAIVNSGFEFPRQRIIVNLAPADLPKDGGRFDLPIAIGILVAAGQIKSDQLDEIVLLGELALSGLLRPIKGALVAAISVRHSSQSLILPEANSTEAAMVTNTNVMPAKSLGDVAAALNGLHTLSKVTPGPPEAHQYDIDFSEVVGQTYAKRALEIAAAGNHSVLMCGYPGSGKSMLAHRLPTIMPEMTETEALQSAAIASISYKGFLPEQWKQRPFRSPHHSASGVALIGGGSYPSPGEISLAHNGVLFLDELPEFGRHVLDLLREPLETGYVNISRARRQQCFAARFLLVAAANPCPCGYLGMDDRCRCTPDQVDRYNGKLSGPLLDRIDMQVFVQRVETHEIRTSIHPRDSSAEIRARVASARLRQLQRQCFPNNELSPGQLCQYASLSAETAKILEAAMDRFQLSMRACHRIQKLARTIADLAGATDIENNHLLEAIKLRRGDYGHSKVR